jgi:hypothetical protein
VELLEGRGIHVPMQAQVEVYSKDRVGSGGESPQEVEQLLTGLRCCCCVQARAVRHRHRQREGIGEGLRVIRPKMGVFTELLQDACSDREGRRRRS